MIDTFVEDSLEESIVNQSGPRDIWFAIRSDGQQGRGTRNDPYNGSNRNQFDQFMNGVAVNTTIHLGPGVFQTRGGRGVNQALYGWLPKSGQRVVGSGMFATTLKLVLDAADTNVPPPDSSRHLFAIGADYAASDLTSYEVSGLTVDCNMGGQPATPGLG
ncbi:MAG: hypothetical protein AAB393_03335, partial [Bacteroidota bacterium]